MVYRRCQQALTFCNLRVLETEVRRVTAGSCNVLGFRGAGLGEHGFRGVLEESIEKLTSHTIDGLSALRGFQTLRIGYTEMVPLTDEVLSAMKVVPRNDAGDFVTGITSLSDAVSAPLQGILHNQCLKGETGHPRK